MNDNKKSDQKVGEVLGTILLLCVIAIAIGGTIKLLQWMF